MAGLLYAPLRPRQPQLPNTHGTRCHSVAAVPLCPLYRQRQPSACTYETTLLGIVAREAKLQFDFLDQLSRRSSKLNR